MPRPETVDEFLSTLRKSGLIPDEQLDKTIARLGLNRATDPLEAAKTLIADRAITRFQAKRLLQGERRGLVFDGYKLLESLGVGGMGRLYIAEEIATQWRVAIKVLSESLCHDEGTLSRFRLEAEAGIRLRHPNVLRTFSINTTDDIYGQMHYVVMELVKGVNLIELLWLKHPVAWEEICDIIYQAAVGLHYAHQQGLVHRDVKPDNLLIRSDGAVKVLDFGLAMIDEDDEEFSMAMIHGHDRLGTADYVAPEQSLSSYNVDARADVYGLGCTFYAGLTGKVPFPYKSNRDKLAAHRTEKPRPIKQFRPDVPDRVAAIIQKMMAKKPEERFATAADVARYLKPLAKRQSVDIDFPRVLAERERAAKKSRAAKARAASTVFSQSAVGSEARQSVLGGAGQSQIEPLFSDEKASESASGEQQDAGEGD